MRSVTHYNEPMKNLSLKSRTEIDKHFMALAITQAQLAGAANEVPVGAVVVVNNAVIATACNQREANADPSAHAELLAIRQAASKLGRWRLSDCTVYVTLEPCPMCAGLMHQARIARCVYATADPKAGALGSLYELHNDTRLNHNFAVSSGVCEHEAAALLQDFFKLRRRSADKSATEPSEPDREPGETNQEGSP